MKILVAMVSDGSSIRPMDAIEYEGKIWLVPAWLEWPAEGWKKPERIICLRDAQYQRLPSGNPMGADLSVPVPVPKAALEGHGQQIAATGYDVIEHPEIRVSIPKGIH